MSGKSLSSASPPKSKKALPPQAAVAKDTHLPTPHGDSAVTPNNGGTSGSPLLGRGGRDFQALTKFCLQDFFMSSLYTTAQEVREMTRERIKIGAWMAVGSALTICAAATMQHAQAQRQGGQGGGFGGQGGGQGGFGGQGGGFPGGGGQGGFPGGPGGQGGGFPGGGPMGMMRGPGGGASLTATDKYVYVLQGNMLYQYSVEGLKLTAKVQLPQQQGGPGGPGGFPGGGPGGPGGPPDGGFGGPPPSADNSGTKTK